MVRKHLLKPNNGSLHSPGEAASVRTIASCSCAGSDLTSRTGRELSKGHGFLVLLDSPARTVRCTTAMIDAAIAFDIWARSGVHAVEVEFQGDEVRGIAMHIAARILAVAQPGEVLVSSTVRDLLAGSGLAFEDRGEYELKGLEGRRSLAALIR